MNDILVTVVLPIYNVEKYLVRSIESVINQTYKNLDIILVDDGSPDNCSDICDSFEKKDERIRVKHKTNEGLGMARNTGIEMAKGEYIFFFDSDDYVDSTLVERCVAAVRQTDADIVVYGYDRLDKNGRVVLSSFPELPKPIMKDGDINDFVIPCLAGPMIVDGKRYHMPSSAWGAMYSMRIIKENGFRFVSEREIISEDVYSNLKYYRYVTCIATIPEILYHYCDNNPNSLTRSHDPKRFERNKHFYNLALRLCDELGYSKQTKINLSNQMLSNIVAVIKHIIASSTENKRGRVKEILHDQVTIKVVSDFDINLEKKHFRKILIWLIRNKSANMVYILLKAKYIIEKNK